jgi:regulator of replication initiation timing
MNYEDLEGEFECYSAMITIQETFQEIYEIMGIADIGKNITGVIDATQKIADIAIRIQSTEILDSILELKKQLVDIKGSLVDAKEENVDLRQKNFEIQEENKKLKEQIESVDKPKLVEQLIYKDQLWFVKADEHQAPVCRNCTDKTNRFIYMSKSDIKPVGAITGKEYKCPECSDSIVIHDELQTTYTFIS